MKIIDLIDMSFSEFDVTRRTRKGNLLNQIDCLIDSKPIEKAIAEHYASHSISQAVLPIPVRCCSKCFAGRNLARWTQ